MQLIKTKTVEADMEAVMTTSDTADISSGFYPLVFTHFVPKIQILDRSFRIFLGENLFWKNISVKNLSASEKYYHFMV
jgi:hypothetical protein